MFEHANRTIAPTLALVLAAAAFQTARAVPFGLAEPEDPIQPSAVDEQSNDQALLSVRQLLSERRFVRARVLALSLIEDDSRRLTNPQNTQAHELIVSADDRIRRMDPLEVSLRRSEVALDSGDLATALRHAEAVTAHASATAEQALGAETILRRIDAERRELAPLVSATIAQVRRDFDNRRYAEAKSGLDAIHRSAVVLTEAQGDVAAMYRSMIVSREEVRGKPFSFTPVSLGMLQPDVVTRRNEPEAQPEEEAQPEQPPKPPAPKLEELPDEQPEPEAQPEPQPEPQIADLIQIAMRAEAMGILGEANRALQRNEWVTAQTKYRQLQDEFLIYLSDEQRELIRNRLEQAAIELNQPTEGEIGPAIDRAEAVRSQTRAEFDHLMNRANAALRTGDISSARAAQAEARLIINGRRQYFNEDQYNEFDRQIEQLRSRLDTAENRLIQEERRKQIDLFEKDAADTQKRIAEERRHQIDEYIDRARSYQAEGQYQEALQTIERLLFLDPNNPSGLLLRDVYRDILIFTRAMQIQTEKRYNYATLQLDNADALIPPPGIVNFPAHWRAISLRRGEPSSFQDSPENAAIYADLRTQRIPSIALNDNTLEEVVEYVETVTSHDVDADWGELATVSIQPETTVSLSLNNVTVETLLDRVLDKVSADDLSRAAWEVRDGIITISSDQAIRKHTFLHIYDIRDMLLDTPDYDEVPEIDLQQAMQQSSSGRGGGGSSQSPFDDDEDAQDEDRRTLEDRTLEIIDIITNNVDFEGWVENGGETGNIQNWNGNLIITNTVANHQQIGGLLQQLRAVRAMQINVETRFLLINQDFFEQIGFDLDVYWNANNNQFRAAVANDPTVLPSDFFDFGGGTNLGRQVTGAQAPLAPTTTPQNTELTQGVINPRSFSLIGTPQNSLGLAESLMPAAGIASSVLGGAPALGIAGQFVDDIQVDFLVKATQADRRSVALTAPRLTFMNGQIANIFVATQQAYISDLQPVVADSAVGFDPTIAVATEGVTMLIEGVISSDRRYVTMNVDVGISRIDGFATQPVTAVAGGQLVNSADTASFIQLPQVTVTRVRTSVTVPDQGTVLLGGQRLTTEFEVESGVPVLSKIPILNRFFSNRIQSRDEQTLLILIRPTVLIQSELEENFEPGLNSLLRSGLGG